MRLQVLVATMNQKDHSLLSKMNIQTDAIIGNQCNWNCVEKFIWDGHEIIYLNFNERGVGLNRNNALMRASADIALFADDDMVYVDGYEAIVIEEFKKQPTADVIIFNLHEPKEKRKLNKKNKRVNWTNFLRYGTARIAIRVNAIRDNGILFYLTYGGGTKHSHGEDSLFLANCLKKKLRVIAVPQYIAKLTEERPSSWDNGINEKYIKDQGDLFFQVSPKFWKLLCLQDVIRHKEKYKGGIWKTYKRMTRQ